MRSARNGVVRGSVQRPGFTLVELAVVLIIIGVMMSILVPSLAAVRASARKVQTLTVMNNVSNAASQFITDRRTVPGYFSAAEMGSPENGDVAASPAATGDDSAGGRSFSSMQNVLIDLAGGLTADQSAGAATGGVLRVGPTAARLANIDPGQIGVASKNSGDSSRAYFLPDRAYYVAQETVDRQAGTVDAHRQLPTLVDAFGYPILAWVGDERAATIVRSNATDLNFGANQADAATIARYYWVQNRAFLAATNLGGRGRNQIWDGTTGRLCSVIGSGNAASSVAASLAGILGNPGLPLRDGLDTNLGPAPGAARGSVVFHSAGPNGYYVGSNERGGIKARRTRSGGTTGESTIPNSVDYVTGATDAMDDFDDQIVAVGG